jgi:hypothetical protein
MNVVRLFCLLAAILTVLADETLAQASSITYQGQLRDAGQPFTGLADLEFRLYDQLNGGSQVGVSQSLGAVPVEDGLFQVELDFGAASFDGSDRFLEVSVNGAPLVPRQKVTATPYALLAAGLSAGSVGSAGVDPTEIQLRVVGSCPSEEFVQQINQNGGVVCGTASGSGGGTVTQVDTGTGLTGGPITGIGTIAIAPGGVGATEIDPATVQQRVVGTCPADGYVQEVNADGTVVCGTDTDSGGTLTQVDTGLGLTGGPVTETGTISVDPAQVQRRVIGTCPAGEYLTSINEDGSAQCGTDEDSGGTLTQVDTGTGLTGGPITDTGTIAIASGGVGETEIDPAAVQRRIRTACRAGEFLQQINEDGTAVCGVDRNTGGTLTRVDTGAGLTGGPITDAGTIAIAPGGVGQVEIDPAQVQRRVIGICPPATYLQTVFEDGTVGCGADAQGNDWRLGGNAGTDPTTDFLGTTDLSPLEIRTANVRSLRIEPSVETFNGTPITTNTIAGSSANEVSPGVRGATISGGGVPNGDVEPNILGNEFPNRVTGHYGTVGGGLLNIAGDESGSGSNQDYATVGGGLRNFASRNGSTIGGGIGNTASGQQSTVGGGLRNLASGSSTAISGGNDNVASGISSYVGGGDNNRASSSGSTVSGGTSNEADGLYSAVSGGLRNRASGARSSVGGGTDNIASGFAATIVGGEQNEAAGSYSFVAGRKAKNSDAAHAGVFIFADSQNADFTSTGSDQFLVRAQGGVGFGLTPTDHFDIQTPFSQVSGSGVGTQGAFRVRLNGATRLRLLGNGGLAVGDGYDGSGVPENGIRVQGRIRLGSLASGGTFQVCRNAANEIATCSSSARYKHDIEFLDLGMDALLALRPVAYRWNEDNLEDIGFVAEEVAAIDERLITRNRDGEVEGVRYDRLSAILVHSMQQMDEHYEEVTHSLEGKVQHMGEQTEAIRARMVKLQTDYNRRLQALQQQQDSELNSLRVELAMLRELVSPRIAQGVN